MLVVGGSRVTPERLVPRFGRIGFLARELLDEIPHTLATV